MTGTPAFENVTETTGIPLTPEAAEMMYTRYHAAAQAAESKRVLELGCGAGQGFGLLSRSARFLVGGDYSLPLLRDARRHYGSASRSFVSRRNRSRFRTRRSISF